jgi:hypothetical protein
MTTESDVGLYTAKGISPPDEPQFLEEPEEFLTLSDAKRDLMWTTMHVLDQMVDIPRVDSLSDDFCAGGSNPNFRSIRDRRDHFHPDDSHPFYRSIFKQVTPLDHYRVFVNVWEQFFSQIVRDDSTLATRGVDGIDDVFREVCVGSGLKEQLEVTSARDIPSEFIDGAKSLRVAQQAYGNYCASISDSDPRPIRVLSGLSSEVLTYGAGTVELPDNEVIQFFRDNPTLPAKYVDGETTGIIHQGQSAAESGRLLVRPRIPVLYMCDFHLKTDEVLCFDRSVLVQLERADDEKRPYFNGIIVFVPSGAPIHIDIATKHFIPLPSHGIPCSVVSFDKGTTTGKKDFNHGPYTTCRYAF